MDRPTLSQSWNRVAKLTPVLRPQVQISRQLYRSEPWYVVHDPVSNAFFRLNPVAYHFVGLLDGRRSVDQAWNLTMERYGDDAPTQNEAIGLLGQLNSSNLLRVDLPADAQPLLRRHNKRKFKQWSGQLMNVLFMRMPMANPDPMLKWMLPLFRPLLNRWGLIAWFAWMAFVLMRFLPEMRTFTRDVDNILAPTNVGWMVLLFILVKAWHEFGHGIVCRRLGGAVPEVGIMLLVLFPAPYVDATSSWSFPDKWKRLLVGAAGMMFELALAGVAAMVWLNTEPGLTHQLAYNVVFLASVTTLLFNANFLIRFDGYYMLSDLLEIPNLYERAKKHLYWLVQRYGYGMTNVFPVSTAPGEQWLLLIYGIASAIYRVILMTGITLFIVGKFFLVGIIMALWTIISWLVVPLGKLMRYLAVDPSLHRKRGRAVGVTMATLVLLLVGLGAIPAPEQRYASGIVESATRADVSPGSDGFVEKVLVKNGQSVTEGQLIMEMHNPQLVAHLAELEAHLAELEYADNQALAKDPVAYQMNKERLVALQEALEEARHRVEQLKVRAPMTGTLIGPQMQNWRGQYVQRGAVVARVMDLDALRVTAMVDQAQNDSLFGSKGSGASAIARVEVRTAAEKGKARTSELLQVFDAGRTQLPHPALGYAGGGSIPTETDDPEGRTATQPQFELWLALPKVDQDGAPVWALPGERVYVRLTLSHWRPLAWQWVHKGRQVLRNRLSI